MSAQEHIDPPLVNRTDSSFGVDGASTVGDYFVTSRKRLDASARRDEEELIDAARGQPLSSQSRKALDRAEKDAIADDLVSDTVDGVTFHQRLAPVLRLLPGAVPQIEIQYKNLVVEADAAVGLSNNPSLWNSAVGVLNSLLLRGRANKQPLRILDGVNGALRPGKLTLLIGPPGSGKSVFLQALSGRLKPHGGLRVSGSIEYNGQPLDSFMVQRAAGLVDQYDHHIAELSVLETLQFAHACLTNQQQVDAGLTELERKLAAIEASTVREQNTLVQMEEGRAGATRSGPAGAGRAAPREKEASPGPEPQTLTANGASAAGDTPFARQPLPIGGAPDVGTETDEEFMDAASRRASSAASLASAYTDAREVLGEGTLASPGGVPVPSEGEPGAPSPAELAADAYKRAALMKHSSTYHLAAPKPLDANFMLQILQVLRHKLKPYIIMKLMGLSHAADTRIGDGMTRGISGGERKRVTTGEVLVGPQSVLLMDEISTGLDSATTYSVIRTFRNACHTLHRTMLVSLLQPPPEVMRLFDDLLIITDGHVIYHGPVESVLGFFADLGFVCPPRKDPGSFLQEVTTPAGQLTYATKALLEERQVPESLRNPRQLISQPPTTLLTPVADVADAFWRGTEWGRDMLARLDSGKPGKGAAEPLPTTRYANSWVFLAGMVLKRQSLLTLVRGRAFMIARAVQALVMALIIGSLFVDIQPSPDSWRKVIALCALTTIFLVMMSTPQLSLVFMTKHVFFKHRDNRLFPAWSYACGLALTQVVPSTLEALLFCIPVYFMVNFERTAGHFFTFLLVAWSCSNCLAGLFRLIAFSTPSLLVGNPVTGLVILILVITNGFSIVYPDIPKYIVWIYYINPLAWTVRAVSINELMSPQWQFPGPPAGGGMTQGEFALSVFGMSTNTIFIWMSVVFSWVFLLIFTILGALALTITDPPKPRPTIAAEEGKEEVKRSVFSTVGRMASMTSRAVSALSSRHSNASGNLETLTSIELQALPAKHVIIPFTPITLVCRGIEYYVPDPAKGKGSGRGIVKGTGDAELDGKLQLLHDISLVAEPGRLMALMGGSGAGKTTLMDVICGRKTVGVIRGDILVNGHPKDQATWSRVVGYVEQTDIHSAPVTVRESLLFSARLRLEESVSYDQVKSIVEETLLMVELDRIAGRVVGGDGSGISIEQRKRLSIAVELVANPSVVFMDEPTSGLDARAAAIVMRAVRNVADSQRTVMVTIHQPSLEIFESFDAMVLLQRGGRLTYFGDLGYESSTLVAYLEAQPGVEPIRPGYNPATWMLEVTGGSMSTTFKDAGQDFPTLYKASSLYQANETHAAHVMAVGAETHRPLSLSSQFAVSHAMQRRWLIRKFCKMYWYLPEYNMTRIMLTVVISLVYGATYFDQGRIPTDGSLNVARVQNVSGLIFSMSMFLGMFNCMSIMPFISAERTVFYRERAAAMYAPGPYTLATSIAEIPYLLIQTVIMAAISYWMVGFDPVAWKFFYFLLMFGLSLTMYTLFGQFLIYLTPNQLLAMLLAAAFNQLWAIFNGFLMPYPSIGQGWKWMNRISPSTWSLYGLTCSQLCDQDVPMADLAGQETTVSAFVEEYFGWEYGFIWWCALILLAYCIFFRTASVILLSRVNFLKR